MPKGNQLKPIKRKLEPHEICHLTIKGALRETFPNTEFFWSVLSHILTEYKKIQTTLLVHCFILIFIPDNWILNEGTNFFRTKGKTALCFDLLCNFAIFQFVMQFYFLIKLTTNSRIKNHFHLAFWIEFLSLVFTLFLVSFFNLTSHLMWLPTLK